MITSQDLANMKADIVSVINDDKVLITIRRSGQNLVAQNLRIASPGYKARPLRTDGVKETQADIMVIGESTLDIKKGDKFIYNSFLFEVIWVNPGQDIQTVAEAIIRG